MLLAASRLPAMVADRFTPIPWKTRRRRNPTFLGADNFRNIIEAQRQSSRRDRSKVENGEAVDGARLMIGFNQAQNSKKHS